MMFRSSNPTLSANVFSKTRNYGVGEAMTVQGTVNKCFILLFLVVLSASWVWGMVMQPAPILEGWEGQQAASQTPAMVGTLIGVGAIGGFIMAMVTIFKKEWAAVTAPMYALLQGLALGGISAYYEAMYPGLVMQAVALTFGTLFSLLMAYKSGLIRVTEKFRMGMAAAIGGIMVLYLVNFVMSFFGASIPIISSNSGFGIGFSVVVVVIAALSLVLDFDRIEQGAGMGAPKFMEWYAAFGLMVTLIWLYLEILRLLSKLRSRR